jgi:hypothetical protein
MPLFGLNTNDLYVKNLRRSADGSEIDDAVLSASVYDETQIEAVLNGSAAAPISGAADVTLVYQSGSTTPGHYRGSIAETVGLTIGQPVLVHYIDDGSYGIDVKVQTTVQRRMS